MEIKLLGPLEAHESGISIVPSARKPRQALSLLALQAGEVVTVPALMDELWGTQPPASALTTVQTYILQLRRRIAAALTDPSEPDTARDTASDTAKDILETRYGGYLLNIAPGDVDVRTYENLATAGNQALEIGDLDSASAFFGQALDVWRGEMLVDVQVGLRLGIEVTRLEESRLGVLESRIEADLRLGRHVFLLAELAVLTAQHPMHENLCGKHMIALHRAGRQWQALEAFTKLRNKLVNELGVEPSARLQRVQQAILRSDPSLDADLAGAGASALAGM